MTIAVRTSQTPGSCSSTRTCRPANSLPSEICPFEPTILTLVLVARVSICNLRALSLASRSAAAPSALFVCNGALIRHDCTIARRSNIRNFKYLGGGEGGMRTHDTLSRLPVFHPCTVHHSL